jgi:hypothetical protein
VTVSEPKKSYKFFADEAIQPVCHLMSYKPDRTEDGFVSGMNPPRIKTTFASKPTLQKRSIVS